MFMLFADSIVDFLEYLEVDKNRSEKTISNYHHYLMRLDEFKPNLKISGIDKELIRKWKLWLNRYQDTHGDNLSKTTQNYHLIALRSYLKYLAQIDIEALPSDKIELASAKRKQVTFLSYEEIKRLLDQPDLSSDIGKRDQAILELLFSSGLRVSELVNLNRQDINLKRQEFMVRGKGQKDRPVFISAEAANAINNYLNIRTDSADPLFIHYSGTKNLLDSGSYLRLSARSIQRMIKKYSLLAGITKRVTPHTMRHSFATDLLMNGADIRSVQGLLGHSNIATTQIYTHITDPHLKKVHSDFHRKDPN